MFWRKRSEPTVRAGDFQTIIPTRTGRDLTNMDETEDAHIRIETYKAIGTRIYVDVFDSSVQDPSAAHIVSEMFPWSDEGADEATQFLQKHKFRVAVVLK